MEIEESVTSSRMMMMNDLNLIGLIGVMNIAFAYQAFRKAFLLFPLTYPAFSWQIVQ